MGGRFSLAIALSAVAAATSFAVEPAEPKPALGSEEDPPNLAESHFQFYQDLLQSEVSRDWAAAFENLTLAAHFGHSAAQHSLAAAYATGLFHGLRVPMDPGRSLAVDYFAALAGSPEAHMSAGYRSLKGLGVAQSCEKAALHYEFAANYAVNQIASRGYALRAVQAQLTNHIPWLSDDDNEAELIQYYDRMAQEGDVRSIHTLGMLYMQGSLHTDQDLSKAASYFQLGADASYSASSGQLGLMYARGVGVKADPIKAVEILQRASRQGDPTAILGLGYCYHLGLGVESNLTAALELYQSVTNKHEEAGFLTAELILNAKDTQVIDVVSNGQSELSGARKELQLLGVAQQFYMASANRGHVLSIHRVAHISRILKNSQACAIAQHFKAVAEAGDWGHKSTIAHRQYNEGNIRGALQLFSELAFQGYESAQMNAAFILSKMYCPEKLKLCTNEANAFPSDNTPCSPQVYLANQQLRSLSKSDQVEEAVASVEYGVFYMPSQWVADSQQYARELERSYTTMHTGHDGGFATIPHVDAMECELRALALYAHSAHQGSGTAYLKVGDFHYYGLGGLHRDKLEAARYYQIAADLKNTHALFNLGIMHQTGDGVLKDFHLAKRFFDEAAVYDSSAKIPSTVAVAILQWQQFLYSVLGQSVAADLLNELSQIIIAGDNFFGLGLFIFAARSRLLRAWLSLNKSVLISTSSRFESNAYSSANTVLDKISSKAESYVYILKHALRKSHIEAKMKDFFRSTTSIVSDQPKVTADIFFNSDVAATMLFFTSIAMFLIVLRYRAARRMRHGV